MARTPHPEIPHSWRVPDWPQKIFPGTPAKGRYIVRGHRDELIAAGALARVGRELVVFGGPYVAWLNTHRGRVEGSEIAANKYRDAMRLIDAGQSIEATAATLGVSVEKLSEWLENRSERAAARSGAR